MSIGNTILGSGANRRLFRAAQECDSGFAVPVRVKDGPYLDIVTGEWFPAYYHTATASFASNLKGTDYESYRADVKASYIVRVWPK